MIQASGRLKIVEYEPEKWATYPEMEYIRDSLIDRGFETEILDLSRGDLNYAIDALRIKGDPNRIDLIYKRILWGDLARSKPETKDALAHAYLNDNVSVVNSLGSRVAGNKMLLTLLETPSFQNWAEQNDPLVVDDLASFRGCLPASIIWGDAPVIDWGNPELSRAAVLDEPHRFVLKSFHGFGGGEVLIGPDLKDASAVFEDRWNKDYIAQEYVPHGRSPMAVERGSEISWEQHHFILGAYVIGGQCVGIEAKTSPSLPINMSQGGFRTAVFPVRVVPVRIVACATLRGVLQMDEERNRLSVKATETVHRKYAKGDYIISVAPETKRKLRLGRFAVVARKIEFLGRDEVKPELARRDIPLKTEFRVHARVVTFSERAIRRGKSKKDRKNMKVCPDEVRIDQSIRNAVGIPFVYAGTTVTVWRVKMPLWQHVAYFFRYRVARLLGFRYFFIASALRTFTIWRKGSAVCLSIPFRSSEPMRRTSSSSRARSK